MHVSNLILQQSARSNKLDQTLADIQTHLAEQDKGSVALGKEIRTVQDEIVTVHEEIARMKDEIAGVRDTVAHIQADSKFTKSIVVYLQDDSLLMKTIIKRFQEEFVVLGKNLVSVKETVAQLQENEDKTNADNADIKASLQNLTRVVTSALVNT